MWAVFKKEIKTYFCTPIGYVFIGLFLAMCSIFFYIDVYMSKSAKFEELFYSVSSVLTFIVPILTMRMFSEERKNGTEQILLTTPKSITDIVMGKFLSATGIIVITEVATLMYFIILRCFGNPEVLISITTLLGFLLLSMAYISFGMFASSLTENQIVAGVITIAFFIITWFLPEFSEAFSSFSLINLFSNFPSGRVSISDITSLTTFTVLFVLLTIIVLQRRKSIK